MSVATAVIEARQGYLDKVREHLKSFAEIDIYGENVALGKILVTIDADDERIEKIGKELARHEGVLDVLNHSIFFEESLK